MKFLEDSSLGIFLSQKVTVKIVIVFVSLSKNGWNPGLGSTLAQGRPILAPFKYHPVMGVAHL